MTALLDAERRARVVYVAGSGHSGSTLLAMLMNGHPEIASVGESAVKPKIRRRGAEAAQQCSCGQTYSDCPFWARVFGLVRQQGCDFGPTCWSNDYRLENPAAHRLLSRDTSYRPLREFQLWAARHLPVYRARVRRVDRTNVAFVRAVLDVTGASVFFDTSKQLLRLLHLRRLPELDVKVVLLVRDARGYAASAKRRGRSLVDAAWTWRRDQVGILEAFGSGGTDRMLIVRYEDLCAKPEVVLGTLCEFARVAPPEPVDALLTREHHVIGNNMRMSKRLRVSADDAWRASLDEDEQRQVLRIAGRVNEKFGYAAH